MLPCMDPPQRMSSPTHATSNAWSNSRRQPLPCRKRPPLWPRLYAQVSCEAKRRDRRWVVSGAAQLPRPACGWGSSRRWRRRPLKPWSSTCRSQNRRPLGTRPSLHLPSPPSHWHRLPRSPRKASVPPSLRRPSLGPDPSEIGSSSVCPIEGPFSRSSGRCRPGVTCRLETLPAGDERSRARVCAQGGCLHRGTRERWQPGRSSKRRRERCREGKD
jgi:hypothetical protein